jgi:hypothetical protein
MSENDLTLLNLFELEPGKGAGAIGEKVANAKKSGELKQALEKKSSLIRWDAVKDVLAEKTVEALDIPAVTFLFPAWKKYEEIMEFGDPNKHPPKDTYLVALAEHTMKSDHHPYLQVSYKGYQFPKIEFTLSLELTVQGIVMRIHDGKIKEIKEGTLKGKGKLLLENEVIIDKAIGSVDLPTKIDLGDGIPLRDFEG